jgi:hypothetical protein
MDNSILQRSLQVINSDNPYRAGHWLNTSRPGRLLLIETIGKEHQAITELITQLALGGSFNLVAGDEWLPDRDTLYRSIRRNTVHMEEILDHPDITCPMTYLQMLDLLMEANMQKKPTLILNFLCHFYNADVELSLRERTLEKCCQYTKRLSLFNSVVILVPRLFTEDYRRFFPMLSSIATEIISIEELITIEACQDVLF